MDKSNQKWSNRAVAKPKDGDDYNRIAAVLNVLAVITFIIGFIGGLFALGISFLIVLLYWFAAFVSGMMLLGLAEAITLLQRQLSRTYEVFVAEADQAETEAAQRAAAPQTAVLHADQRSLTARFATRPTGQLICLLCNQTQDAARKCCYNCGAKFVFEDEEAGN